MVQTLPYQSRRPLRVLLYSLEASFVDSDSRNERFDVRGILPWILHISRRDVLPVLLATLGNFQAAV